ncbi:O-antigen ligase family protein [Deltaproteobacteria bacterium]|nr:O-antigen ligase family protein [Deltaproteobacteria bacterium]
MQMFVVYLTSLAVFLSPFARAAEIPIIILAVCGLVLMAKDFRSVWSRKSIKLFSLLFLLLWLPIIFSFPDAVKPIIALRLFGEYLRFYFFGLLLIFYLENSSLQKRIISLVSFSLIFWIVDALIQAGTGKNLLGYPINPGRLNGLFGKDLKLGLYLAVYAPLLMVFTVLLKNKFSKLSLWGMLTLVILLAGSRAGWISFAVACAGLLGYLFLKHQKINWKLTVVVTALLISTAGASYFIVPSFAARLNQSMLVFSGDLRLIDKAVSTRLPIWSVAADMFLDHPINGVGAKEFRYAYNEYADDGDPFANATGDDTGAMHAHNMILDVGCETGLFGLLGLLGFCGVLIFIWFQADNEQKLQAAPFAIGLLVTLFPLNTHFAFYSGSWTQVIFWYTALYISAISFTGNVAIVENHCYK